MSYLLLLVLSFLWLGFFGFLYACGRQRDDVGLEWVGVLYRAKYRVSFPYYQRSEWYMSLDGGSVVITRHRRRTLYDTSSSTRTRVHYRWIIVRCVRLGWGVVGWGGPDRRLVLVLMFRLVIIAASMMITTHYNFVSGGANTIAPPQNRIFFSISYWGFVGLGVLTWRRTSNMRQI